MIVAPHIHPVGEQGRPRWARSPAGPRAERRRIPQRILRPVAAAAALLVATPGSPRAHEIPASVTVQAIVRADQERLRLLIRVPLESMRDIVFPLKDGPYIDIAESDPHLRQAAKVWLADYIRMFEGDRLLAEPAIAGVRVSLPSDRSFMSYDQAVANVLGPPLPPETVLPWTQALLDVLLEYPVESAESRFSIDPALAHLGLRTATVLRFIPSGGGERVSQYQGNPGVVRLDPRWHQAAFSFVALGFHHILSGLDHLLFVFCLVIPFRRLRPLVIIVSSFTVAHSITLVASAFGLAPGALWFPPLIETLIALSIVYMAIENIVGPRLERRWVIAFVFGLVHGFGFSFLLRESLQFAGTHVTTSLLAFNAGVELGQLFVLAVALPVLAALFKYVLPERAGTIVLSALVAHEAWHWMTARAGELRQYRFTAPAVDAAFIATAMRWLMLLLILAGALWLLFALYSRLSRGRSDEGLPAGD